MSTMTNDLVFVAGRALPALAFIGPGSLHLFDGWRGRGLSATVAFAAVELAAGLALLMGWQARWIALALSVFLLVDAFASHAFWSVALADRSDQALHFFKNLALAGGFVLLAAVAVSDGR
jgi:putative oxidoreductase